MLEPLWWQDRKLMLCRGPLDSSGWIAGLLLSPYRDPDLLVATFLGSALAAQLTDGKYSGKTAMDEVYRSALG